MSLGETTRNVVTAVIYLVFFVYLCSSVLRAPELPAMLIYLVIMVFFGFFGLLSEYLRYLYHKAIKVLVIDCQPERALIGLAKVEKFDLLRGYKNAEVVFRTLAMVDMNQPAELLQYMEGPAKKTLEYSLDMKLVYYYNRFYASYMLGNCEEVEEIYQKLMNLRTTGKGKRHRVSPIYSWDVIIGDHFLALGDYTKAHRQYEQCTTANMNNREQAHLYLSRAAACGGMGHPREQEKYLKLAQQVAPQMPRVLSFIQ